MTPAPLYQRVLGDAWTALPEPLQALHAVTGEHRFRGAADVDRGRGPLAAAAAAVIGFPPAGRDVPVEVTLRRMGDSELWVRSFAGRQFRTRQRSGHRERLLIESFGPIDFVIELAVEEGRLRLLMRGWRLYGLPLPAMLAPRADAYESAQDGRFHFYVEVRQPLVGLIVRYRGWLQPA